MHNPLKNSYLQKVCSVDPRNINKAVDNAMTKLGLGPQDEEMLGRLESLQPSLFSPHVDITRAKLGYERIGLDLLIRQLHSPNQLEQVQALHTVLDQLAVTENAVYLIEKNLVCRLIDLLSVRSPVMREKTCMIYACLATYHNALRAILQQPIIIENILWMTYKDKKEIRYASAYALKVISGEQCAPQAMCKLDLTIPVLLDIVVKEHTGIILLHLKTLEHLFDWDQEEPLKNDAFKIMLAMFSCEHPRIVAGAMTCMERLLRDDAALKLADNHDMNFFLRKFLDSPDEEIRLKSLSLMKVTTLTVRSKWRIREMLKDIVEVLVRTARLTNSPSLQLNAMQVLTNLCDSPDMRKYLLRYNYKPIKNIIIKSHEEWDGSYATYEDVDMGHHYRTRYIRDKETCKNDSGDKYYDICAVNLQKYLETVNKAKERLLEALKWKPY